MDLNAFCAKLDGLDALLRREGMPCGPDVWQSVFRLLRRMDGQGRLPDDERRLAPLLGPLFCRHPEDQARFPVLFEQWLSDGAAIASVNRMVAPERAAVAAANAALKKSRRYWLAGALLLIGMGFALQVYLETDKPVQASVPEQIRPGPQPKPVQATRAGPSIAIVDRVMPRLQPEPPSESLQKSVRTTLNWLPWLLALLWLTRTYRRRWLLNRQPASGDDLLNHFRFERVLAPIFGGAEAERALRDLRAARFQPARRLDVAATVEATARSGDFFHPVYRNRRFAPEHLLLVRSRHRNDLQAALAEELAARFHKLGLSVEAYRFRDDPRRLTHWNENGGGYFDLAQLAARHGSARLLVISETDVLFHPYSGEVRPWLKNAFKPWQDQGLIWLHPREAGSEAAALLTDNDFLVLPLARDSLPELAARLTAPEEKRSTAASSQSLPLPDLLAGEPDAWLREKPPFGADPSELVRQLECFLGSYGLRLLRAVAVYPKPHWPLAQALDYLLYGRLGADDPPERREARLARLSRLPWLTHAYLPDWLREYLLIGMDDGEPKKDWRVLGKRAAIGSLHALCALFLLISLLTFNREDPGWTHSGSSETILNGFGAAGAWVADFGLSLFGLAAYGFPAIIGRKGYLIYRSRNPSMPTRVRVLRWLGVLLTVIAGAAMADLYLPGPGMALPDGAGGMIGRAAGNAAAMMLGNSGAALFFGLGLLAGLALSMRPALRNASGPASAKNFMAESKVAAVNNSERQLIIEAWRRLFAQLTDKEGRDTLSLEIRLPPKRQIRLRLNDLQAMKNAASVNDAIFANILLGGKLGLLDFRLPTALARLLPAAGRWLVLRPLLAALVVAGFSVWGLNQAWQPYGQPALSRLEKNWYERENAGWSLSIDYRLDARLLAENLRKNLEAAQFHQAAAQLTADAAYPRNRIFYAAGGKPVAQRVAKTLAWQSYGAPVELSESSALAANTLHVQLSGTYQHGAGFNDMLRNTYRKPGQANNIKLNSYPIEPDMAVIKPGKFLMGSGANESGRDSDEGPQHQVNIDYSFAIGKREVTFDEYGRFAEATGRIIPDNYGWGRGKRPVINVSFADAEAYVRWLSQQTGKNYRLPTEAEWEYAARAGSTGAYSWSNGKVGDYAWYSKNSESKAQAVGQKKPNAFGLYDIAGNVYEWTQDCWHDGYLNAPPDGSAWLEDDGGDCGRRVVRGGSWLDDPQDLRSANRLGNGADYAYFLLGFRVARAL